MAEMPDLSLPSHLLLDAFEVAAQEKALLSYTDAPDAELTAVQIKIDTIRNELHRRMSW